MFPIEFLVEDSGLSEIEYNRGSVSELLTTTKAEFQLPFGERRSVFPVTKGKFLSLQECCSTIYLFTVPQGTFPIVLLAKNCSRFGRRERDRLNVAEQSPLAEDFEIAAVSVIIATL